MTVWLVIDKSDYCFAVVQNIQSLVWLQTECDSWLRVLLLNNYVEEGREKRKEGSKAISDWLEGGKTFYKEVKDGQWFVVHFKSRSICPRWVKQWKSREQTI